MVRKIEAIEVKLYRDTEWGDLTNNRKKNNCKKINKRSGSTFLGRGEGLLRGWRGWMEVAWRVRMNVATEKRGG